MNFKIAVSFFLIMSLLFFTTCKKENATDCIKRTGKIIKETRNITGFDKVLIENNLNVFITQDSVFEVIVEAGENIIPLIKTEVHNGTLICKNKNRCNWSRSYGKPLNVYIKMPAVKYLTSNGTGDIISLNTITADSFDVQTKNSGNFTLTVNSKRILSHMHGAGDVTLVGNTNEHACDNGGTGFLYCKELSTSYTYLHTFTLGLCYINVTDLLICKIDQKGDVFCYGNPKTVQYSTSNSGKLYIK